MCLYPTLIKNPKYKPNKKNGGKIPAVTDQRVLYVPVGCNNCIECRRKKARDWQIRLLEDIKTNTTGKFITLTFSDESITQLSQGLTIKGYTLDNKIATIATRLFLERWRKTYGKSLRHWFITELGHQGTNNIHIHGIIWLDKAEQIHELDNHWQYGYTFKGKPIYNKDKITQYENYVNDRTIAYIIKYVTKLDEHHKHYKPIILTSPGIGNNYTKNTTGDWNKNQYNGTDTKEYYKTTTGHKIALPVYYRNKIYTEIEREQLWLQKLDEQTRYVLGTKIDISKNTDNYQNLIQVAREKNHRLGYGTNRINYDEKQYEQQQRVLQQITRLIKGKQKIINQKLKLLNKASRNTKLWDAPF